MDGRDSTAGRQVFRPYRVLAGIMGAAGLLWLIVLVYLFRFDDVPWQTWVSTVFFILFFGVAVAYYGRTLIVVDAGGMTYRGMLRTRHFSFADILKVDVLPGLVTVYAVRGSRGLVHFTSFFAHHRRLAKLLIERAGLTPLRT